MIEKPIAVGAVLDLQRRPPAGGGERPRQGDQRLIGRLAGLRRTVETVGPEVTADVAGNHPRLAADRRPAGNRDVLEVAIGMKPDERVASTANDC